MSLQGIQRKVSTRALALLAALLLVLPSTLTATGAQTRPRTRRARSSSSTGSSTTNASRNANANRSIAANRTTPTPVAVPRLPPAAKTAANTTMPSIQPRATGASAHATVTTAPAQNQAQTTQTPQNQSQTPPPQSQTPAQQTPKPATTPAETVEDDDEVVRVTSNLVVVPVSVTTAAGEPVLGLKREDFRLEEEGRVQEIAQVGDADQVPLDIAVLFDVSSSVSEEYAFQQQAAARFLKQVLKPIDRAAIFAIRDKPSVEQPLSTAEEATKKLLTIPVASVSTPTAFYDSVVAAARYLAQNAPGRHRRVVLVISDGEDNFSDRIRETAIEEVRAVGKATSDAERERVRAARRKTQQELHRKALQEVQREVQGADTVFYSINPTGPSYHLNEISTRAQVGMQQLADTTGGSAFVPAKLEELETVFRQIASELRSQYLLQYYPNNDAPPGKFLSIKVQTPARADLRVRARQGYYATKPK